MTRSQKRNLPHESDGYISEEKVVVIHRQANFKMKKHGYDFDSKTRRDVLYDADTKEFISGWKLTPEQIQDLIKNKNVGKF